MVLKFELLEEKCSGKKVSLFSLKMFGCISCVLVDSDKSDKLDAKAKKCVFIGYETNYFGYWFWDEENFKIIMSRDVTLNGNELYKEKFRSNVCEVIKVVVEYTKNPEDDGI